MARRLAAILSADVVGYSRLMSEDEAGTLAALKTHRLELFDPAVAQRGGRVVKLMGDGVLVEFTSVVDAVECALAIQVALAEKQGNIHLRIGINLGDVIIEGDDIYGDGVNIAARLEQMAEPGGILISDDVYRHSKGKTEASFADLGEKRFKNLEQPVRVWRWRREEKGDRLPAAPAAAAHDRPAIAVLPFANMSDEKEQEYFSDGITEDIITDLSRISQLVVIARNSTFSYKGQSVKAQQVSADLGASFLVEGSVRKAGNRVRVTAQLIDGSTGAHVWAERYDRDLTDVFEVQDEIAKNIVNALKVAIAPNELRAIERIPTKNPEAYDRYLRGRRLLYDMTRLNLESAREMFREAIALDPDYAIAITGLADCDATFFIFYSSDLSYVEAAISNSQKALKLDPGIAEAHSSMAFALSLKGDNAAAEREFKTAIRLDPMLYEAYWYFGLSKIMLGELELAAQLFRQASRVRGDDLQSKMMLMNMLFGVGRKADTQAAARETFAIASRRLELNPEDARAAYIGAQALIHLEDTQRAMKWLDIAARIDSTDPRTTYNLACGYSVLGQIDKALEFLESSIEGGRPIRMMLWAETDPDLQATRADPRFAELMERWRQAAEATQTSSASKT